MDKMQIQKRLDDVVENYRKDMFLFDGGNELATAEEVKALSEMTFYAISHIAKIISDALA